MSGITMEDELKQMEVCGCGSTKKCCYPTCGDMKCLLQHEQYKIREEEHRRQCIINKAKFDEDMIRISKQKERFKAMGLTESGLFICKCGFTYKHESDKKKHLKTKRHINNI